MPLPPGGLYRLFCGVLFEPMTGTLSVRVQSLRKMASPLRFCPGVVSWTRSLTKSRFFERASEILASSESRRVGRNLTIFFCSFASYFWTVVRHSLWNSAGKEMLPGIIGGEIGRPSHRGLIFWPYRRRWVSEKTRILSLVLTSDLTGSACSRTILKLSFVRRGSGVFCFSGDFCSTGDFCLTGDFSSTVLFLMSFLIFIRSANQLFSPIQCSFHWTFSVITL